MPSVAIRKRGRESSSRPFTIEKERRLDLGLLRREKRGGGEAQLHVVCAVLGKGKREKKKNEVVF